MFHCLIGRRPYDTLKKKDWKKKKTDSFLPSLKVEFYLIVKKNTARDKNFFFSNFSVQVKC